MKQKLQTEFEIDQIEHSIRDKRNHVATKENSRKEPVLIRLQ